MLFGHNSNVRTGDATFHVQTEDRGVAHGLIDTTVYSQGRVLHRRTNNYFDLLPLTPETEKALKSRVDDQHRTVIQEIVTGSLKLHSESVAVSPALENLFTAKILTQAAPVSSPRHLLLELVNAKSWLAGKRVKLDVSVKDKETGVAVAKASVTAEIAGAVQGQQFKGETAADGRTLLDFDMPKLGSGGAELVIDAVSGEAKAQLRFQLKAKAKVPQAS
jgi:hypothetical protein